MGYPKDMQDWQEEIHAWAREKGWFEDREKSVDTVLAMIALCHTELSEAVEEVRKHGVDPKKFSYRREIVTWVDHPSNRQSIMKPEGLGPELADTVIRIMDLCEWLGISLQACIREKMRYNRQRAYRHGGKLA